MLSDNMLDAISGRIEAHEDHLIAQSRVAQACCDFERTLNGLVEIAQLILDINDRWRSDVFTGSCPYKSEYDAQVKQLFQAWLDISPLTIDLLGFFENENFEGGINGDLAYRECLQRLQSVLADWSSPGLSVAIGLRDDRLTRDHSKWLKEFIASPANQ